MHDIAFKMHPPPELTVSIPLCKLNIPDKIILFGTAARDEMGTNSDVSLLVVANELLVRSYDYYSGEFTTFETLLCGCGH